MTDLNISFEDGQLLSSLVNDLSQVQYEMEHMTQMNLDAYGIPVVLIVGAGILVTLSLCVETDWDGKVKAAIAATSVILIIGLCLLACEGVTWYLEHIKILDLEMQAEGLEAQINVLLIKYGLTWGDLPMLGINP